VRSARTVVSVSTWCHGDGRLKYRQRLRCRFLDVEPLMQWARQRAAQSAACKPEQGWWLYRPKECATHCSVQLIVGRIGSKCSRICRACLLERLWLAKSHAHMLLMPCSPRDLISINHDAN